MTSDVNNTYDVPLSSSTPYKKTKSLDIKGLTYQNSGNVSIILRCEKDGYLPQIKEFNLHAIIDEKEVYAHFNLVKDY